MLPTPDWLELPEPVSTARLQYPCALAQRRFWVLEQMAPGNPALNVAVRWRLEGAVEAAQLEKAFRLILQRHEILRSGLHTRQGEPVQIVEPALPFHIPVFDLSEMAADAATAEAERLAGIEAVAPFSLNQPLLLRVSLIRLPGQAAVLLLTAHHAICDGWSIGLLAAEMGEICAAWHQGRLPQLPELPLSYGDFAAWQQEWLESGELAADIEYWRGALVGLPYFELPPDRPRPPQRGSQGAIVSRLLPRSLSDGLTLLARQQGCTLYMLCQGVLLTLLHRYSGETDLALGTQVVGRDEVEIENLVGLFINTLVLRHRLDPEQPFTALLQQVREVVGGAFEHQHMPLELVIEMLKPRRDPSRNPLFAINFIFQRSFIANQDYGAFRLIDLPSHVAGAMYDLNFFMVERPEGWRFSCECNTELFSPETVAALLRHGENLMRAVLAAPETPLAQLALLDGRERQHLIHDLNATAQSYPRDKTLPQLFAEQVARTPRAPALLCGGRTLSYEELAEQVHRLAHLLHQRGVGPGQRVGLLLKRSPEMVIGLLAILHSGAAYVPLDPNYPVERLRHVFADAGMALLLSRAEVLHGLDLGEVPRLLLDEASSEWQRQPATPLPAWPEPTGAAYVIYTSGSTGKPKGVQIPHRALTNLLWAMRRQPGLGSHDTLLAVTTVSFDIAALELFLPLIVGARLVLAREEEAMDGRQLLWLLQQHRVTTLQATPVTWQLLLNAGWQGDPSLRMLCGGEALPRPLAERLLQQGDDLWNVYGPTETTIWSSACKVVLDDGPVRVGPPIANTQFHVLDARGELVPEGVAGELYIGGDGVADGYFGQPEKTAERFVPDPFHPQAGARLYRTGDLVRRRPGGMLEFLGRADHQVKLRGFRIELGEIEAVLQADPAVEEAVAMLGQDEHGEGALWAYAVARAGSGEPEALKARWRQQLQAELPLYMRPQALVLLPALPRTPNGKVDRKALPPPGPETVAPAVAPAVVATAGDALEDQLATIWGSILGLSRVDPEANFFELGGHSLLAARMLARIDERFGRHLSLNDLLKFPTVRAQAGLLRKFGRRAEDFPQIVKLQPKGQAPALIALNNTGIYYLLAQKLGETQPFISLQLFDPAFPREQLPANLQEVAAGYVRLIRQAQPQGPYNLLGWCIGAALAFEAAQQLRADGQVVANLVLVDGWVPGYIRRMPWLKGVMVQNYYRWRGIAAEIRQVTHGEKSLVAALAYLYGRARDKFLRTFPRLTRIGRIAAGSDTPSAESYDQWLFGYMRSVTQQYEPSTYPGRIHILRCDRDPDGPWLDRDMGWGRYAREGTHVCTVRGNHYTMFQDPGAGEMADYLQRVLRGE
ncbi:MAG: hypothetical protein RIR00_1052 [Pseudomonadota bacterium]